MNEYIQLSQQFKDQELELLISRTQDEELAENTVNSIVIFGSVITLVLVFGYSLIVVNLKSSKVS
ncbi:hypothetical protein HW132_36130 [Brasilonema sp. CT11]|nr:hypothetical protein [Brasilonema sp. CT11]